MSPSERFLHISNASRVVNPSLDSRDKGFVLELAIRFGGSPFNCSQLEGQYIEDDVVLDHYDVGPELRNRTLTDRRVLGSRLPEMGFLDANDVAQTFELTTAGMGLAIAELHQLAVQGET